MREWTVTLCIVVVQVLSVLTATLSERHHGTHSITDTDQDCPAPSPCSCFDSDIDCSGRNLKNVPHFFKPSPKTTHYVWQIHLEKNQISSIPSRAFENLTISELTMSDNNISNIADDAFVGSEHTLSEIYMQDNMFRELPSAIGNLRNLSLLSVHSNPLTSLREDVLRNISLSLEDLDVGSADMITWPQSIGVLKSLEYLTFRNLPMSDLPLEAFFGLDSLHLLEFQAPRLRKIPDGIRKLKHLTSISITDDEVLTNEGFSKDSFTGMLNLTDVDIYDSGLTEIPDFSSIPNLQSISVSNADINKWDKSTLPPTPVITSVLLDHTSFTSVPTVIALLPTLEGVSLMYTDIPNIGSNDFRGLSRLADLNLGFSPIRNISDDAFETNPAMQQLSLHYTNLTEFPKAIQYIRDVKYINFNGNKINCTCESMGWLKNWHHSPDFSPSIDGNCDNLNGMLIQVYVLEHVPKCK